MSRSDQLPVPAGPPYGDEKAGAQARRCAASKVGAFDAQLIGQDGVRRGLRGGAPVLAAARASYLETEWGGEADRRLPSGLLTRKRV